MMKQQVAVCIWSVHAVVVVLSGVGFVKQNGREIAWVLTGLDKIFETQLCKCPLFYKYSRYHYVIKEKC